ncbi:MAG: hypothetical protein LBM77_11225 [Spirochaetaceae bacterium]|jgi:hypothetical protein|nr:hypothetical protein [Spirochaetaceae bacterium]
MPSQKIVLLPLPHAERFNTEFQHQEVGAGVEKGRETTLILLGAPDILPLNEL